MKRLSAILATTVASMLPLLVAATGTANAADPGPAAGINVNVVNAPGNPVPVTGTVTGSVTGTVDLAPGSAVTVVNPVNDPVRVRSVNDAIQPIQASTACNVEAGTTECSFGSFSPTVYHVPAGKRFVIEYASIEVVCTLPGQTFNLVVSTKLAGDRYAVSHSVGNTPPAMGPGSTSLVCNLSNPSSLTALGQRVRLYADPDTDVFVSVVRNSALGLSLIGSIAVSGYLVDIPFTP